MGSLTSRPSVPRYQPPVFVSAPVPAPVAVAVTPPVTVPEENNVTENKQASVSEAHKDTDTSVVSSADSGDEAKRDQNLLSRRRGRLSTIRTGFGGILTQAVQGRAAKTLLGE